MFHLYKNETTLDKNKKTLIQWIVPKKPHKLAGGGRAEQDKIS